MPTGSLAALLVAFLASAALAACGSDHDDTSATGVQTDEDDDAGSDVEETDDQEAPAPVEETPSFGTPEE